jgi:hypothetical protein
VQFLADSRLFYRIDVNWRITSVRFILA